MCYMTWANRIVMGTFYLTVHHVAMEIHVFVRVYFLVTKRWYMNVQQTCKYYKILIKKKFTIY